MASQKKREMNSKGLTIIKLENHKVPDFCEVKGVDWVTYGEKNDYPDYLLQIFNRSAKHNAIITGKVHYIKGNGFVVKDELAPEMVANVEHFIKNINKYDSLDDLLYKTANDLEIFSGVALQVIPRKDGKGIAQICHIDKSKIRVNKKKNKIWYANKWSDGINKFYKPNAERDGLIELKVFDPKTFSGVYIYDQYRPGNGDYPLPEYIGCIPYIQIDYEIANFHLNNIKHGFAAGTMISFNNGEPGVEEQAIIERKIKGKYAGSDKAGEVVIVFSNGKDSAPTIVPLTSNNFDKLFDTLNQTVQQEIFTGHKITSPMLFGIKTEGQLGGSAEIQQAFELFKNGYVSAKQRMLEDIFNYLFSLNGMGEPLMIQQIEPISFNLSEDNLMQVLTKDEIRQKLGEPMSEKPANPQIQKTLDALNSLSPLVATKVLETMTQDEIRALAELPPAPVEPAPEAPGATPLPGSPVQTGMKYVPFRTEEDIIKIFSQFGVESKSVTVRESFEVEDKKDAHSKELAFYRKQFEKDDLIPSAKDIKIPKNLPPNEKVIIMYSYEVRAGFGAALIDTSRDFCRKMIGLNRFYSRDDIDKISKQLGYDVWKMRGGFYHDPKLDVTTAFCRHVWKQNVVVKNG